MRSRTLSACWATRARFNVGLIFQLHHFNILPYVKFSIKWSRENGSVVKKWTGQDSNNAAILTIDSEGKDSVLGFAPGGWIELTDDTLELQGKPGTLVKVVLVEGKNLTINVGTILYSDFPKNPKIRSWDMPNGKIPVTVPSGNNGYIALEDGVEVKFFGRGAGGGYLSDR